MVCAGLLAATTAAAAYTFEYQRQVRLDAGEAGRVMPVSVTRDATTGEICITDTRQVTFHLLNEAEVPVFRSQRLARLSYPQDGAVDPAGRIVFTDRAPAGGSQIRRLTILGEPDVYEAERPDADWNPQHLLITRDGAYVSLDPTAGLLTKHDPQNGHLVWARSCRIEGLEGEQLGRPAEAPDGRLYVPGGDLRLVMVLSPEGQLLETFGRFGSAPGRVILPVGVAFGPAGEVLVLDRLRAKVLVFTADHEFVTEFGSIGFRPGQFYHPLSLAATGDGQVYITQGFEGRVQVFQLAQRPAR
ncbi:MAG: NHL repeat-containing protein [Candidatus Krumholzibacteriia bacterium]